MRNKSQIPDRLYFRIGDVADLLGVKPYVLRYWETEFPMIHPQKSSSGHRVYRRSDVETVMMIKRLLYEERYSLEGARKKIKELRKGGDLKEFKVESVAAVLPPVSEAVPSKAIVGELDASASDQVARSTRNPEEMRLLSQDLREIMKVSVSDLFLY